MVMHAIEIEDKIWQHLKKFAEPFEDTPNSVLMRLLFPGQKKYTKNQIDRIEKVDKSNLNEDDEENLDEYIDVQGVPKALSQVLEVLYEMKVHGLSRVAATSKVAKRRGTSLGTVTDKYCRQLNKKAQEIDLLFKEPDLESFKELLKSKFTLFHDVIEMYFDTLTGWDESKAATGDGKLFSNNPNFRTLELERV
jgi:hypothetical protein